MLPTSRHAAEKKALTACVDIFKQLQQQIGANPKHNKAIATAHETLGLTFNQIFKEWDKSHQQLHQIMNQAARNSRIITDKNLDGT